MSLDFKMSEGKPPPYQVTEKVVSLVALTLNAARSIIASNNRHDTNVTDECCVSQTDENTTAAASSLLGMMPPLTFQPQGRPTQYFSVPAAPETTAAIVEIVDVGSPSEPGSALLPGASTSSWTRKKLAMQQQAVLRTCGSAVELHADKWRAAAAEPVAIRSSDGLLVHEAENEVSTPEMRLLANVLQRMTPRAHNTQESLLDPSSSANCTVLESSLGQDPAARPEVGKVLHRPLHHTDSSSDAHGERSNITCDLKHHITALLMNQSMWCCAEMCNFHVAALPNTSTSIIPLNDHELHFVLNCAFHCPVRPIARAYRELLRVLDANGQVSRSYYKLLQCDSAREEDDEVSPCSRGWLCRVPPASLVLTELAEYLDLLDAGFGCRIAMDAISSCPALSECASVRNAVLGDIFLEMGEVNNYYRVLSTFPNVLAHHHKAMQFLFHAEGPLSLSDRYMIAIMAASRHKCEYLVRRFSVGLLLFSDERDAAQHFLLHGPDDRLKQLREVIALLAHQPWNLTAGKIDQLINTGACWTVAEIVHACCVVTTVLALSGLTMGLAVPTEISTCALLPTILPLRQIVPLPMTDSGAATQQTPAHSAVSPQDSEGQALGGLSAEAAPPQEPLPRCGSLPAVHDAGTLPFSRFCGVDAIASQPRITRGASNQSLNEGLFSWQERGGTLVEQYYPQFADLMSSEIASVDSLLRHQDGGSMVRKNPDMESSHVWRSLRLYLLNLIGIVVDDFQYQNINNILTRGVKTFVQKSSAYPERLTLTDLGDWSVASAPMSRGVMSSTPSFADDVLPPKVADSARKSASDAATTSSQHRTGLPYEEDDRRWFTDEVTVALVALVTFETRREGLMLCFLSALSQYLRSM